MEEMCKVKDDFGEKFRKALLVSNNIKEKSQKIDLLLNINNKDKY